METDEAVDTVHDEDMESSDSDSESSTSSDSTANDSQPKEVYLPGKPLEEDEELVCDESAYIMLHQAHTGAPCLSFDIIKDDLGSDREEFPMSAYIVSGTQASSTHLNNIIVMKMSNLQKTNKDKDEDAESDDSDEDDNEDQVDNEYKKPTMACALIRHNGCVNRIRSTRIGNNVFAASWSELGRVNIWNLNKQLQAVEDANMLRQYEMELFSNPDKPVFTFSGHRQEGFAIDWSLTNPGALATGDCRRDIHIWKPLDDCSWSIDQRPLVGHTDSVEDLQWSPNENSVLASCSVDKSIRIWDIRASAAKACMLSNENCHESDVNVISWNRNDAQIASGGDDGFLHIWDLRRFQEKTPIASFKHHTNHITTVEWHPTDSTVLATGGSDDQIAIWDLALERDGDIEKEAEASKLPPQLLFIHQGQKDIKELHWHPQIPGLMLSTAHSGFNVFKTISV